MSTIKLLTVILMFIVVATCLAEGGEGKKKKSVSEMTDSEIEQIYEEWEKVEEPLPDDELPNYMRKSQNIDMSKLKEMGPEGVKSMSKKGKTLMMFVTVAGTPTDRETEELTALWQSSLFNANLQTTRYVMESNKAIFMVDDGSKAYEIKDFLVRQENCLEVVIDQETYPGIYAKEDDMTWSKGGKKAKKVKKSAKKSEEKNYEEKKSEEKKNEKEDL